MTFYWSPRSMPELRHYPLRMQDAIVHRAIRTLSVSFWSGLLVVGFIVGAGALGVVVAITLGSIAGLVFSGVVCLFVKPMLLNLARPRIKEILRQM